MKQFIEQLNLSETIFRSDHASNNLILKGVLGKDKQKFLNQITLAINHSSIANLTQSTHNRTLF